MLLTYEAIDEQGRQSTDTTEASHPREAVDQLRRRGLYVTYITEASRHADPPITHLALPDGARLPLRTLTMFTRQMAMLLRAGSGIVPAIQAIKRQMRKPAYAALLARLVLDLEEGTTLCEALRKHPRSFDAVYCAVVAAGEASASLTEMFERLAVIVAKRRTLQNKLIGALAYPCLLVVMSFNIMLTLLLFVIPRFNTMFTQLAVETPATTKMLLSVSEMITGYWPHGVAIAFFGIVAACLLFRSRRGRQWMTDAQLSIPLVGRLRSRLIQGQLFRTLGMLLESNVGVLEALALARESTKSRRYLQLFDDVEEAVTSGGHISEVFDRAGLVEPYICQAVHTGEESGSLGGAMSYCADILDETNTELVNALMRLLEPAILICMGVVVGAVAIALFMPLFDLTAAIGQ